MSSTFATTFASPVGSSFDAQGNVMRTLPSPSPSRQSSRPPSTKSTRSLKRTTFTSPRSTPVSAPPLPIVKGAAETAPRALDPLFQNPFGAAVPNMYDSSASLSPSDDSGSEGPATRREKRSRRRRERRQQEVSTTPTTASSSSNSMHKSARSSTQRPGATERRLLGSALSKRAAPTAKESLSRGSGYQGLGVEIDGLGWDQSMRTGNRYKDAASQHPPITSATYTSDLGSGISTQGSSPEVPQLGHAASHPPIPLHSYGPAPIPTPPSPSRSRSSRARQNSNHSASNGEVRAAKGAPRFLSEQVDNHEHESAYPTVDLHPEHIVFATPASTSSKSASRRNSTASNLRTPSLTHSPASVSQTYPETPALPSPSTYAHRDHHLDRNKSISSVGSSRSRAGSSQAYSIGLPTPSATRHADSNAYFPPPPPPKSPRRYALPMGEDAGATPIPQVFPSPRPRQSTSTRATSGPFPGPPPSSPRAKSHRSPAPSSTSVFPSAPRSPAPTSPTNRRQSEIFPSVRQRPVSMAPDTRASPSAPWEENGEDELDWMVSAQRKLEPKSRSPRAATTSDGVRQVVAARRVEQPRSSEEQRAYEREEGGLGRDFESVADFESLRAIDALSLVQRGREGAEVEVLQDATPIDAVAAALSRSAVSEDEPPKTRHHHHHHTKRYSQSSATSGASDYASATEHDGEDEGAEMTSLFDAPSPSTPELAVFPAPATTIAPSLDPGDEPAGCWVLDDIVNSVVNGNARRMSAIGEVSENETPSSKDSAQASGAGEREGFDSSRLNTKKLSLTPASLFKSTAEGRSGDATPMASTPTRAEACSLPPSQDPHVSTYSSALSSSLRSPYSPTIATPPRPAFQRSSSANSRASLYNHSNSSSLSAQTHLSGHSSHRSSPTSHRTRGSQFTKKLGAFFGGGSTSDRGVPPHPQGISSEQVRGWAAEDEEPKEVLQDAMIEGKAASTGGTDEIVLLSESGSRKEEVVHFESLLEKFQREERQRLVELKASKWAAAQAAAQAAGSVETRVEPVV